MPFFSSPFFVKIMQEEDTGKEGDMTAFLCFCCFVSFVVDVVVVLCVCVLVVGMEW